MDIRTERCKKEYEGKHYFTRDGKEEFVVINYNAASDIEIEFINSGFRKKTTLGNINNRLPNPFTSNSPIAFEDPLKAMIGCYFRTNQGYLIRIIGGTNLSNLSYQFQDEFGYIGQTTIRNIRKGEIRNPYHRNECGGYIGVGAYKASGPLYKLWYSMISRGTGVKSKYSGFDNLYKDSMVCNEWLNFNMFADWYTKAISKKNPNYQYIIDKDLLFPLYKNQTNNIKLYSPTTVVLIPKDLSLNIFNLNSSIEKYNYCLHTILELSEKYKNDNAISSKCYNAIQSIYNNRQKTYIDFRKNNYNNDAYRIN